MYPVFTDKTLNENFIKNGFIKVKLLTKNEIEEVKRQLNEFYLNRATLSETLSVSLWSNDYELKLFADNLIKQTLLNKLNLLLNDYEAIWGDIIIKQPHIFKTFELHQDWTFVDEEQFMSVNVWCPLQDVNYWNGGLQVVPKSHLILDKIRGLNITPSYNKIGNSIKSKYAVNVKAEMGEAILFSHALLHASPPNRTLKKRMVIGLNLKPKVAPITHYLLNKKNETIEKYNVQPDYFLRIGQKTNFATAIKTGFNDYEVEGDFIESFPPILQEMTMDEFNTLIKQ